MTPPLVERRARIRVRLGAVVVLLLAGLAAAVLFSALAPRGTTSSIAQPSSTSTAEPSQASSATIFVHILGEVARPGLYELREGDRAVDAVAAAGGFTETADQSQLNLARFVTDGEQILVLAIGAAPPPGGGQAAPGVVAGKVNINTADAAALETLPRVGPALSARILEWRAANGRFTAIEDLMSVTGIGEKTFEGLKDLVTV